MTEGDRALSSDGGTSIPNFSRSIIARSSQRSYSVTVVLPSQRSVSVPPTRDRLPRCVRMLTLRLLVNLESALVEQ